MKKRLGALVLMLVMCISIFSFSGCYGDIFIPKMLGNPLGMYLYHETTKTFLDGSYSKQIVEQVEYDGVYFDINITDHRYLNDYLYFCAEFDDNNSIGLFRYDFSNQSTATIFVKNISDKTIYTSLSIRHITNFFVTLERCEFGGEGYCGEYEFGKHEYFSVDYFGNIVDTGFDDSERYSDEIAYTGSYRLTKEYTGSESIYTIEHLITREKITLGTVPGYQGGFYLNFYETEKFFCFITQKGDPYTKYLVLYNKETKTLHKELWGVSGDAYVIDMDAALFYANKIIYKYEANVGLVAIHVSEYHLANCQVLHNGIVVFSVYDSNENRHFSYYYDMKKNQRIMDTAQVEYYGTGQYFFDGYIFYITERHQMMWTTHYYLNRVNLATGENEIVSHSTNMEISFTRIGY